MPADLEFNVRNGMTVGSSKHTVLDVNGGVSARGLTLVTGQILSGGSDILTVASNEIQITESQITDLQDYLLASDIASAGNWDATYVAVTGNSGNWDTAFSWGNHATQSYATQTYVTNAISDVISGAPEALNTLNELASALNDDANFATNVTNSIATKWTQDNTKIANWDNTYTNVRTNSANWDTAYSWGDHATQNYLTDYTVTVHDVTAHEGSIEITESQITDLQDYLTDYTVTVHDVTGHEGSIEITESQITDLKSYLLASDIVSADNWSVAYTTVTANSANWNSAFNWGDHAAANYLTDYTVTVHDVTGHQSSLEITESQITDLQDYLLASDIVSSTNWDAAYVAVTGASANWDTAYGWGDHAAANYLTDYTVTVHDVTGHEGSIEITESQITDLQNYATQTYVTNAISDVISGAPEALNTLNELASALNDDADFAGTITASIATKWTQDNTKITNWDNTYTNVRTNSANWNSAFNWGDHAAANYLTDYTVTVHDVTGHEGSIEITESQITDLQDYLTDYTVTVHDVTAHEGSIDITESQITDLQSYLLASDIVSADNWSLAYTAVTANSASWASHTDVSDLSNTVATNSGNWDVTYATVTAYSAEWSTPGTTTLAGATDANITSPTKGEILVYTNGGTQKWTNKTDRAGLEEMYNYANIQFYNELSYSSTDSTVLTGVDVYVTSAKATHLFSREFVYSTTGALTSIVTTDEQNNNTLTKNMYYHTTTGALTSVTRSYS